MGRIADESDFLELLIANERVARLLDGVTSSVNGPRYATIRSVGIVVMRYLVKQRMAGSCELEEFGMVRWSMSAGILCPRCAGACRR
jgi:hypothetical protein